MYPVDFPQRLIKAEQATMGSGNCISAAFWLLGLDKREIEIDPYLDNDRIVSTFEVIDRVRSIPSSIPDEAVLVGIWGETEYWHLGVISPFNRDQIIDRPNHGLPIRLTTYQDIIQQFFNIPDDPLYASYKNVDPSFDVLKVRPEMYLK
jgi:hypothetical protein